MDNPNKTPWWKTPLVKELIIVLIIKLILIIIIYQVWFDEPIPQSEQMIEQHLLGHS